MTTQFDSNTFEHDYIISVLMHMITDLKTDKPVEQIIDKYAVSLTAFMTGQIVPGDKKLSNERQPRRFTDGTVRGRKTVEKWFDKHPTYADKGEEFKFLLWNAWLIATQTEREGSACLKATQEIRQEIASVNCDAATDTARAVNSACTRSRKVDSRHREARC